MFSLYLLIFQLFYIKEIYFIVLRSIQRKEIFGKTSGSMKFWGVTFET